MPESSTLPLPSNGHPNTPQDSLSSEDETRQDKLLRKRSKKSNLADELVTPTTPPNWDDYPEPAPPKLVTPVPHVDANARSTSARIAGQPDANVCSANARIAARTDASVCSEDARTAAQYAEERTSHAKWQQNGAAMQVESTDFPIQNVELMPSNSIQTAYTPILMPTLRSEDLSLRRSNVDGNFYSHEFDHAEVIEAMDESASQTSSVDRPWKRVFEAPARRVYPVPNGSLRERTLPSVRVQELAEPLQIPNGSLRERSPPGARVQEIVEPLQPPNSLELAGPPYG